MGLFAYIFQRLEVATGLDVRAPGFPAEIVDGEPEAPRAEVRALGHGDQWRRREAAQTFFWGVIGMSCFVLLHGAYQGPWIWKMVAATLRTEGHEVYVPCLEGCGERAASVHLGVTTESQAAEVVEMLRLEDLREVVLVGTSSGGMVMARTAECARDRVRRLVFVDALALLDGEKIRDIVTAPAAIEGSLALGPDRADLLTRSFKDIAPALREWAAERVTLHPRNCFYAPVRLDSFWTETWDADVIYCLRAPNPGRRHLERCAKKLGARWHEIDTGHYPMLTTPAKLARLLVKR